MSLAQSKRAQELQKDLNQWEENRLLQSGCDTAVLFHASSFVHPHQLSLVFFNDTEFFFFFNLISKKKDIKKK